MLQAESVRVRRSGCTGMLPPRIVELDKELAPDRAAAVVHALAARTGAATVPRVFVGGTCIGGATDTAAYARSGALEAALRLAAKCPPVH